MKIISPTEAKKRDHTAQEKLFLPAEILMENAGIRATEEMLRRFPQSRQFYIFVGKGNNGGDGLVVARQLFSAGKKVIVYLTEKQKNYQGLPRIQLDRVRALKIPIQTHPENRVLEPTVLVDSLLGIGTQGSIRGSMKSMIQIMNRLRDTFPNFTRTVSLDVPSGIDAQSGESLGANVKADVTITFDLPKIGLFHKEGDKSSGKIVVVPIGFPNQPQTKKQAKVGLKFAEESHVASILREPGVDAHKGTRGKVLIIAGSPGMAGAGILCSRAALKTGAGIVYLAVPKSIREHVNVVNPEVITLGFSRPEDLTPWIPRVDSIAIGPGMGLAKDTQEIIQSFFRTLKKSPRNVRGVVVDADGLTLLKPFLLPSSGQRSIPVILTPHPGEFERLFSVKLSRLVKDRMAFVKHAAKKTNAIIILKGHKTLVCDRGRETTVNSSGNPGMGTAGAGDVLTGMIAAFLAQKYNPIDACVAGVFVHGRAGDILAKQIGRTGFTAHDLLDTIPHAMETTFAF